MDISKRALNGWTTPSRVRVMGIAALARGLLVVMVSLAVALAIAFGSGSPAIAAAAILVLAGAVVLFSSGQVTRGMLFLMLFLAPVDVGKALIVPTSIYIPDAPGLYLSAMDLAAAGWMAAWLWCSTAKDRQRFAFSRIDVAVLCFLAWIWLEALRSPAGGLGLATAAAYSKYVIVFYFVSHAIRTREDWRTVLVASVAIFAFAAPHVFAQVLTQSYLALPGAKVPDATSTVALGSEWTAFRPTGFFNHPNALADYLVLLLPTPVCALIMHKHLPRRAVRIAAVIVALGGSMLILTLTRGGWISLVLAAMVCAGLCWRYGAIRARQVYIGTLVVVLAGIVMVASTPRLLLRLTEPDSRSLESRSLLAGQAMEIIKGQPILGVGFGGYHRAAENYSGPGFAKVSPNYQKGLRQLVVHNHYLLLAAELGVPAAIGFLLIVLALLKRAYKTLASMADPGLFCLGVGLTAALTGNLLFLASDNYYADIRVGMLWLVAGLLQALCLGQSEAARESANSRSLGTYK